MESFGNLMDKAYDRRRVVDGDDVREVIQKVEEITGVTKDEYKIYPEKE